MKKCVFCGKEISKSKGKAKEHVLSRSLLKKLGLDKVTSTGRQFSRSKGQIAPPRIHSMDSIISGDVCSTCNNGWMNSIDLAVEDILVDAYNDRLIIENVQASDRILIARYLLKTAISFVCTEPSERRHIPKEIAGSISNPEYLPAGLICYVSKLPVDASTLFLSRIDVWNIDAIPELQKQTCRLKFGIQFNEFSFCITWLSYPNPCYHPVLGLHQVLLTNKSSLAWTSVLPNILPMDENLINTHVAYTAATLAATRSFFHE